MNNPFEKLQNAAAESSITELKLLMKKAGMDSALKAASVQKIRKATSEISREWAMWLMDLGELIKKPAPNKKDVEKLIGSLEKL